MTSENLSAFFFKWKSTQDREQHKSTQQQSASDGLPGEKPREHAAPENSALAALLTGPITLPSTSGAPGPRLPGTRDIREVNFVEGQARTQPAIVLIKDIVDGQTGTQAGKRRYSEVKLVLDRLVELCELEGKPASKRSRT